MRSKARARKLAKSKSPARPVAPPARAAGPGRPGQGCASGRGRRAPGSRPPNRRRGSGAAPPPALRGGRARRGGSGRRAARSPKAPAPSSPNPLPPPLSGARAREPEARGGGRGGGRRGRAGGGGERKAKVSEKLTKGESNFSSSLALAPSARLGPGQVIFRAFGIVGARAPPLAAASRARRRETPGREGARAGAHRLPGREAAVAQAGRPPALGEQDGAVSRGSELWPRSACPAGAPRGGGRSCPARQPTRAARRRCLRPACPRPAASDPPPPAPSARSDPSAPARREAGRGQGCPGQTARPGSYFLFRRVSAEPGLRLPAPPPLGPRRRSPPRAGPGAPAAARPPAPRAPAAARPRALRPQRRRHRPARPLGPGLRPARRQVGRRRASAAPAALAQARVQRSGQRRTEWNPRLPLSPPRWTGSPARRPGAPCRPPRRSARRRPPPDPPPDPARGPRCTGANPKRELVGGHSPQFSEEVLLSGSALGPAPPSQPQPPALCGRRGKAGPRAPLGDRPGRAFPAGLRSRAGPQPPGPPGPPVTSGPSWCEQGLRSCAGRAAPVLPASLRRGGARVGAFSGLRVRGPPWPPLLAFAARERQLETRRAAAWPSALSAPPAGGGGAARWGSRTGCAQARRGAWWCPRPTGPEAPGWDGPGPGPGSAASLPWVLGEDMHPEQVHQAQAPLEPAAGPEPGSPPSGAP